MNGALRKLVGITRRFVCFVEEVDLGIAVGRGYAPVGKNTRRGRSASRTSGAVGRSTDGGRVLAHRTGRRGAGGGA